ncbi:hypothetical protein Q9L42_018635 [Methylomarinum sp. Ch1-1]|uniref:Uncharacterized protein n=1 Tax=Methylomarinum roseum TaxID=3067653 RepID=A0AAU7NTL3_9GAMM
MANHVDNTEQLILHAIDVWDREMKQLYEPAAGHNCPYCPKRFIYGCFCSFERRFIEQTIEEMVAKGLVSKHDCDGFPEDFCLKKEIE